MIFYYTITDIKFIKSLYILTLTILIICYILILNIDKITLVKFKNWTSIFAGIIVYLNIIYFYIFIILQINLLNCLIVLKFYTLKLYYFTIFNHNN